MTRAPSATRANRATQTPPGSPVSAASWSASTGRPGPGGGSAELQDRPDTPEQQEPGHRVPERRLEQGRATPGHQGHGHRDGDGGEDPVGVADHEGQRGQQHQAEQQRRHRCPVASRAAAPSPGAGSQVPGRGGGHDAGTRGVPADTVRPAVLRWTRTPSSRRPRPARPARGRPRGPRSPRSGQRPGPARPDQDQRGDGGAQDQERGGSGSAATPVPDRPSEVACTPATCQADPQARPGTG